MSTDKKLKRLAIFILVLCAITSVYAMFTLYMVANPSGDPRLQPVDCQIKQGEQNQVIECELK